MTGTDVVGDPPEGAEDRNGPAPAPAPEPARIWVVASGAGRDGAETQGLLELAGRLGMKSGEPPADLCPRGQTLVLVDLFSVDASPRSRPLGKRWIEGEGEALVIRGSRESPRNSGPAYHGRLHPREQLRLLAHRHDPDALARTYGEQPGLYAKDRAQSPVDFDTWLEQQAGSDPSGKDAPTLWREAIELVLGAGGLRQLAELLILPSCGALPLNLVLEAATCIDHCRHRWWDLGDELPERALLVADPRLRSDEAIWRDASTRASVGGLGWLAKLCIYLPKELAESPRLQPLHVNARLKDADCAANQAWNCRYRKRFIPDPGSGSLPEDKLRAFNTQLSAYLGRLLLAGRPLRHMGCTLFLPFDPGAGLDQAFRRALDQQAKQPDCNVERWTYGHARNRDDEQAMRDEMQAQLYFLPELRDLLYQQEVPTSPEAEAQSHALKEWRLRREQLQGWRLGMEQDGASEVLAEVTRVHLYGYYNGTYVLAIGLEAPALPESAWALDSEDDDWWHPLLLATPEVFELLRQRQLETWLGFARLARVIYPSFVEQGEERKIATLHLHLNRGRGPRTISFKASRRPDQGLELEPPALSPILSALLLAFVPETETSLRARIEQWGGMHDDRLFSQLVYALAGPRLPATESSDGIAGGNGPAPGQARGQARGQAQDDAARVFSLALFGDRFVDITKGCDGHAYDPAWVRDALRASSLGLWDAAGVYIGCTEATNTYLGSGDYFARTVARRHVPYAYQRMLLQALFYQATLRRFNKQISGATKALVDPEQLRAGRRDFTELRARFIEFTNLCWFRELTGQLQGKALFALQQQALGLEDEYRLLKDEMERADEYMAARRNERFARLAELVGFAGMVLALVAVWATVMAFVPIDGAIGDLATSWSTPRLWLTWLGRWVMLFLAALVPPLLLAWALTRLVRPWLKRWLRSPGAH